MEDIIKGNIINKKKKMPISTKIFILVCIAAPIINFFVFYLGINFNALLLPFQSPSGQGLSLNNFRVLLEEFNNPYSDLRSSFNNTFIFFGVSILVELPLTFAMSFFFYKKIWGNRVFLNIFFLPSIISGVIITACFKYIIAPDGPVFLIVENIFGNSPLFLQDSGYALKTIIFYNIWMSSGMSLILYTAAFNRIPQSILEAGRLDGLGFWKEIKYILIPLSWPFLSTMLLLSFCGIFGAGGPILLFTKGAYGTFTLSYWIFDKTIEAAGLNLAATLGLVLSVMSVPIILIFRKLADNVEVYEY